ncbi:NADPH-dependent F420 reductase [Salinirubrum litoreum]|uniref:NADPH-dependent F420 reductase n=1 Tax=Salinirubrum litoreum TaxID=1126234 RepID=A0ABD5R9V8_9EURY|nr:NADPH-dependent F420 reductase [Salinirubrum litoreum]
MTTTIGVIGSGNIGRTLAELFVAAGHEVVISNSRGPESLADLVADLGERACAGTVAEAAECGEIVVEAIPFGAYRELPAEALAGKIVVSASNYYPNRDGEIDFGGLSQTELVADHLGESRIVKAFNTMYWETLRDEGRPSATASERLVLFLAGDDPEAKAVVSELIAEIGFAPIDTGSLAVGGRKQEPGSPIYNEPMTSDEARGRLAAMDGEAV